MGRKKDLTELPEEAFEELNDASEDFLVRVSELALEYGVEEQMGTLLMVSWQSQIAHTAPSDEKIPEFVNQFVQLCTKAYKQGELDAESPFDSIEEAVEEADTDE